MRYCFTFFMLLMLRGIGFAQDSADTTGGFKPSGKIWGYAFGDYAYKFHADEHGRGNNQYSKVQEGTHSFNFRRIYLGYDFNFSPYISSQFLLAHESSGEFGSAATDVLENGNRSVYIKAMNMRFKNVIPRATIIAGQQATPTFATLADGIWGYRSVEKSIADMRKISGSSDLGLGLFGKIGKNENVGYDIMVGNNNGSKSENNSFKKLYSSVYAFFLDKKIVVQGNYEMTRIALRPVEINAFTYKVFSAYRTPEFTVGIEAFKQVNTNEGKYIQSASDTALTSVSPVGISFFVTQNLDKKDATLFARLDAYDPDSRFSSDRKYIGYYKNDIEYFATVGVDYMLYKNVHLIPNLWVNKYSSKLPDAKGNLENDFDMAGRITLYFIFNK